MRRLLSSLLLSSALVGIVAPAAAQQPLHSLGATISAMAQPDPSTVVVPSIEFDNADLRDALKALFKIAGVSFTISNEIQGAVNLNMKDKPFEIVLQALVRQVNATYRIEGGVYNIIPIPLESIETPAYEKFSFTREELGVALAKVLDSMHQPYILSPNLKGRITASFEGMAGSSVLTTILTAYEIPVVQGVECLLVGFPPSVGSPITNSDPGVVTASFNATPLDEALQSILGVPMGSFGTRYSSYVIQPGVSGKVSGRLNGLPVTAALDAVLTPLGLEAIRKDGYYLIMKRLALKAARDAAPARKTTVSAKNAKPRTRNR